jgi:hypothetical protein
MGILDQFAQGGRRSAVERRTHDVDHSSDVNTKGHRTLPTGRQIMGHGMHIQREFNREKGEDSEECLRSRIVAFFATLRE